MISSGRLLAVGGAILGVGAPLAVSWLIYAIQSKTSFWSWPGIAGLGVAGLGSRLSAPAVPERTIRTSVCR